MITGVALISSDQEMIALPKPNRHGNLFALAALLGIEANDWAQGFITKGGIFVDRGSALRIVEAWEVPNTAPVGAKELFSEDLW